MPTIVRVVYHAKYLPATNAFRLMLLAAVLQFVFGVLPGLVLFFAFSEIDVFDPATRTLVRRPVGWDHCGYLPGRMEPVEGWDDFQGYYQDRKEVEG